MNSTSPNSQSEASAGSTDGMGAIAEAIKESSRRLALLVKKKLPGVHHVIHTRAVYDREAARHALGLSKSTLRRELRLGRLRCSKRAGRYYILGQWLLEWLESGEMRRDPAPDDGQVDE